VLICCLHGETFNAAVLKVASSNLTTLLSQRPEVQGYELEESDTKHIVTVRLRPATKAPRGRPSPHRGVEENGKKQAETGGSG